DGEIIVRLRVIRADRERGLEVPDGVGQAPLFRQRRAQVVVGFSGGGVTLQRRPIMTDGFVPTPCAGERVPQIVVRFGVTGLERERLPVLRNRFLHPARSRQARAEVVVGFGGGGTLQRLPIMTDGL